MFGAHGDLKLQHGPKLFLSQRTPELARRNLLTPEDFSVMSGSKTSEVFRPVRPLLKGVTMLEGVRYYFSKRPEFAGAEAVVLAHGLGGVLTVDPLSKRRKLALVFNLLRPGDAGLKFDTQTRSGKIYPRADKKTTNTRPFNPKELYPKHADEDPEAYSRRLKAMEDVDYLLALSERLSTEAQVNLSKLSFEEQSVITDAVKAVKQKPERIINLAREYNLDGLRTFVGCERSDEYGEHILRIAEKARPELARAVFEKYGQIIDTGNSVADYLREYFKASQVDIGRIDGIRQHLVLKGNELLKHYSFQLEQADQRKQKGLSQTLLVQLEHVKTNILLFAGAIKEMSSRQEINLEDIEDIRETAVEIKDSSELASAERQEMMRIFEQNRLNVYPDKLFSATKQLFAKAISESGHEFHVLSHQGEITAFIRFDQLPNGNVYAGSLNVRPEIRDSSIGSAMLSATLREKAAGRAVEAEAFAKLPMLDRYLTVYGFRGMGIDESWQGTNELFFKLKVDENTVPDTSLAPQNYEFDLDAQKDELVKKIKPMLAQGWAIVGCKKKDRESNQVTLTLQKFIADPQAEAPAQEQE